MLITGATVLLTGVTGGIGGALAAELSARGAKLVLTGRRRAALEPLAERYGARTVLADLADPSDVEHLADEAADASILIANAALPSSGKKCVAQAVTAVHSHARCGPSRQPVSSK